MRRPGSAALDLCYVAAGRVDAFFELGLSKWDIAAGALIVREAGGRISDFRGSDAYLDSGNVVAATRRSTPRCPSCSRRLPAHRS